LGNEPFCTIHIHKPSVNELLFFFISGIIVSVPFTLFFSQFANLLTVGLTTFSATLVSTVIVAPFVEEFAKVLPLFYRHGETERSIVTLAILLGLGFGITEAFLYVSVLGVPFVARIPGLIFHPSSAAITAYGITQKRPLPYYLLAVGLHLVNNLLVALAIPVLGNIIAIIVIVSVFIIAWQLYHKASPKKIVPNE
jgi:RsiW-degrading membrane proteinase PrsW (M82 family)